MLDALLLRAFPQKHPKISGRRYRRDSSRPRKGPVVRAAIDLVDPFTSKASLPGTGRSREHRVQRGCRGRRQCPANPGQFRQSFAGNLPICDARVISYHCCQLRHHRRVVVRHRTPRNGLGIKLGRGEYEPNGADFASPEMIIESSQLVCSSSGRVFFDLPAHSHMHVFGRQLRKPTPRRRRGPPVRRGGLCMSRSGNGNANCRWMAKRCKNDAIALRQLNEALTSRFIKIPIELEGNLNVLDSHLRRLVDTKRTARIPNAFGYHPSARQLTTH